MADNLPTRAPDWRRDIESMTGEFTRSLPAQVPTERFVRTVLTALQMNPDLVKADRHSLKVACMKAAQDGLLADGREGALVVYAGKVVWQPMVAGLMKLARNSGEIASLTGHVVYKHDRLKLKFGDEESLEHQPDLEVDDKELVEDNAIGAYAIAKLKDGTIVRAWRSRGQIMRAKSVSKAAGGQLWGKWWEEAWIKTAIRYLSKYLPRSTDKEGVDTFARAAERDDEQVDFGKGARDVTPARSKLEAFVETKSAVAEANGHDEETGEVLQEAAAEPVQEQAPVEPPKPARRMRKPTLSSGDLGGTSYSDEEKDLLAEEMFQGPYGPGSSSGRIAVQWPGEPKAQFYDAAYAVQIFRDNMESKGVVWGERCLAQNPALKAEVERL